VRARNHRVENGKTKRLHERCVGVLRGGQDDAITRLPRSLVVIPAVMIMVMMIMGYAGVLVCFGMNGVMLRRVGELLEKMMHPMGGGRDQKKTKRRSGT
jgi:hypothetical protein